METVTTQYYDYVIIGSGFGGSVAALRLSEKGYRILVIEKGRWFNSPNDFARNNWQLKKWLWAPALGLKGIMRLSLFRHVTVLSGVGVGGGSLVYANTLPMPTKNFYNTGSWAGLENWEALLSPHYEKAATMLGATLHPYLSKSDKAMQQLAHEMGDVSKFQKTKVAVYFGKANETVADPFFDGKGPDRTGCNLCGSCMTGCRYNAKNTLDKNYLHLAQQLGCTILAENEVVDVKPIGNHGEEGYDVIYQNTFGFF